MKIAVIGAYSTKFGELWDEDLGSLLAQSQFGALDDAGITVDQIDHIFTGNMSANVISNHVNFGSVVANILQTTAPSTHIEGACASGALAVRAGIAALESGAAHIVLVNGVEKLMDVTSAGGLTKIMAAASHETELMAGATFPGLFALITKLYMARYNLTREQLASVSIKNHRHAIANPQAHFRKEISFDDVMASSLVADPLRVLDCAPTSDGAASLVLTTPEIATSLGKQGIYIIGSAQASDTLALGQRQHFIEFRATQIAGRQALAQAGLTINDIQVAELHDAFSMAELIALEDLGFFQRGAAGPATMGGATTHGAPLVVNPSGGLKAKGHPVGASGVSQLVELTNQLRGQAGQRQVTNARIGLTHSVGGLGTTVAIHIMVNE